MKPKLTEGTVDYSPQQNNTPPSASGNPSLPEAGRHGRAGISPQTQKKIFLSRINVIRQATNRILNELETLETEIEMTE